MDSAAHSLLRTGEDRYWQKRQPWCPAIPIPLQRVNNNCSLISEGGGIEIGAYSLIGTNVEIYDSDFHELDPAKRMSGEPRTAPVCVGKNVFIGSNVRVLKGVTIGDNSVITNGAVVVRSIPSNVIAGGNPAKVLKSLQDTKS